jgi:predicted Zn-dependent protease
METATQMTRKFPKEPKAWEALSKSAIAAGNQSAAKDALGHWLEIEPRSARALCAFGSFLLGSGQPGEARKFMEQAVKDVPNDGIVWLQYARTLAASGETAAAESAKSKGTGMLTLLQKLEAERE